ncbi:MAG TPA: hypothetical protein VGV57_01110, partial [Thermoleophilaceae bacterium]|nr:hypothetical protein [Thermoleophilaceae bacterium]
MQPLHHAALCGQLAVDWHFCESVDREVRAPSSACSYRVATSASMIVASNKRLGRGEIPGDD